MRHEAILASLLGAISTGPALAWEEIDRVSDGQCSFVQQFEGPGTTGIIVTQNQDQFDNGDYVQLTVTNQTWTLKKGVTIADRIVISSDTLEFSTTGAISVEHGFSMLIAHGDMDKFARNVPNFLTIRKGASAVEQLDFSGFYSAWLNFEKCRVLRPIRSSGTEHH